jgi:hypothetical protein
VAPPELQDEPVRKWNWRHALAIVILVLLLGLVGVGSWWSFEPDLADVYEQLDERSQVYPGAAGASTSLALILAMETVLEKPGGLTANDLLPPGRLMDNLPNWEYGVIVQSRDLAKAMREGFSRSPAQSRQDAALAIVEPRFNFDHRSWILPTSEGEYREGLEELQNYLDRLAGTEAGGARFFARADNLERWLRSVEDRLGSLSQRLGASVGGAQVDTILIDQLALSGAPGLNPVDKTPRMEIDDVFFEARGSTWALALFLSAVERDFGTVLDNRNARVSLRQIIRELEAAQEPLFGPVVLNGRGFGIFANHSLVMASYVARAHAATIELRTLLSTG